MRALPALPRRGLTRRLALCAAVTLVPVTALGVSAAPVAAGPDSGLELVATVPYADGTHLQMATINDREYAFASNQARTGVAELRVVDVTAPEEPRVVATLKCGKVQGHLQLAADKTTLILAMDTASLPNACMPGGGEGFATIDVSDPTRPRPVGYATFTGGSHSTAVHPTEPVLYNAPDGDFPTPNYGPGGARLDVWSIADPTAPRLVKSVPMPQATYSPHDLEFNRDGTMAATANIASFHVLDTTDPYDPKIVYNGQCPGCSHTHEARFTADNKTVVVNDEQVFGSAGYPCPGGALYFYSLDGPRSAPTVALKGTYVIDDLGPNAGGRAGFCTPHVFDISKDGTRLAASWHTGGVRYLDITSSTGHTIGTRWSSAPTAVKELGSYTPADADWFTAKFHRGPFIYAVDKGGLRVLRIKPGSR